MIKDLTYSMLSAKIKLYSSTPISSYKKNIAKSQSLKSKQMMYKPLLRDSSTASLDVYHNNGPSLDSSNKNLRGSLSTNSMTNSHSSMRCIKPVIEGRSSTATRRTICSIRRIITDNTRFFLGSLDKKHPLITTNAENYQSDNCTLLIIDYI